MLSRSIHQVIQITPYKPLLLLHRYINDITLKWEKQVEMEKGTEKAVPDLSFMKREQEKITLQPNIYRKENKQHQKENQRFSCHPFEPQLSTDLSGSNSFCGSAAELLVLDVLQPHLHTLLFAEAGQRVSSSQLLELTRFSRVCGVIRSTIQRVQTRGKQRRVGIIHQKRRPHPNISRKVCPPLPIRVEKDYSEYAQEFPTRGKDLWSKGIQDASRKVVITIQANDTDVQSDLALFVPNSIRT
jgi:hypothetical protein